MCVVEKCSSSSGLWGSTTRITERESSAKLYNMCIRGENLFSVERMYNIAFGHHHHITAPLVAFFRHHRRSLCSYNRGLLGSLFLVDVSRGGTSIHAIQRGVSMLLFLEDAAAVVAAF